MLGRSACKTGRSDNLSVCQPTLFPRRMMLFQMDCRNVLRSPLITRRLSSSALSRRAMTVIVPQFLKFQLVPSQSAQGFRRTGRGESSWRTLFGGLENPRLPSTPENHQQGEIASVIMIWMGLYTAVLFRAATTVIGTPHIIQIRVNPAHGPVSPPVCSKLTQIVPKNIFSIIFYYSMLT